MHNTPSLPVRSRVRLDCRRRRLHVWGIVSAEVQYSKPSAMSQGREIWHSKRHLFTRRSLVPYEGTRSEWGALKMAIMAPVPDCNLLIMTDPMIGKIVYVKAEICKRTNKQNESRFQSASLSHFTAPDSFSEMRSIFSCSWPTELVRSSLQIQLFIMKCFKAGKLFIWSSASHGVPIRRLAPLRLRHSKTVQRPIGAFDFGRKGQLSLNVRPNQMYFQVRLSLSICDRSYYTVPNL